MKEALLFPLPPRSRAPTPLSGMFAEVLTDVAPYWSDDPDVLAWGNYSHASALEKLVWRAIPSNHKRVEKTNLTDGVRYEMVRQFISRTERKSAASYFMFRYILSEPALACVGAWNATGRTWNSTDVMLAMLTA